MIPLLPCGPGNLCGKLSFILDLQGFGNGNKVNQPRYSN